MAAENEDTLSQHARQSLQPFVTETRTSRRSHKHKDGRYNIGMLTLILIKLFSAQAHRRLPGEWN